MLGSLSSSPPTSPDDARADRKDRGIDWSKLRRNRRISDALFASAEHLGCCNHFGIDAGLSSFTFERSPWRAPLLKKYLADNFFSLIDGIPDFLPDAPRSNGVTPNSVEKLAQFLTQGFDFERARLSGILSYGPALTALPFGTLDPSHAYDCLFDQLRTKRFVRGIISHLEDLCDLIPTGPLNMIDAGCGPLPILAIAAALYSPRVTVVALESNPISADIARHIVEAFCLSDQITVSVSNAAAYKSLQPVHLGVSETIETGLSRESIAGIVENLAAQLHPAGRIAPERIVIGRGYGPVDTDDAAYFTEKILSRGEPIGVLHGVNFEPIYEWTPLTSSRMPIRVPVLLQHDDFLPDGDAGVYLSTEILLYAKRNGKEEIKLGPSEAVITRPFQLYSKRDAWTQLVPRYDPPDLAAGEHLEVFYEYLPGHATSLRVTSPALEKRIKKY